MGSLKIKLRNLFTMSKDHENYLTLISITLENEYCFLIYSNSSKVLSLFLMDSKVLSCMADGCGFISKEVGINFLVFKRFMYTQSLCEPDN